MTAERTATFFYKASIHIYPKKEIDLALKLKDEYLNSKMDMK